MKEIKEIDGDLWFVENDRGTMKIWYKVRHVLYEKQTPYQHLAILDLYDYGRTLVLDGVIQTTELDASIYNEMLIHVPMVIGRDIRNVLIIGAGAGGVIREALKYAFVERVDVVEIDEEVLRACLREMPGLSGGLSDARVHMHFVDGKQFVADEAVKGMYDLVIIDASDPEGPSEALFAPAFYADVRSALREGGLLSCQSESLVFYRELTQSVRSNLQRLFPVVETATYPMPSYPGGIWTMTLASTKYCLADADFTRLAAETCYIQKESFASYFRLPPVIKGGMV